MKPSICLGTVQFGMSYGILNQSSCLSLKEINEILKYGMDNGINMLDTAQDYGSSERRIGQLVAPNRKIRIVSKLAAACSRETWEEAFQASLSHLNVQSVDAFLIHKSNDLVGPDGQDLLNWLLSLRERQIAKRIGVSIYESSDLEKLPLRHLDIVQLPISLYDQRLAQANVVQSLHDMGIILHARSVFLQGLILTPPEMWSSKPLSDSFLAHHQRSLARAKQIGISMLDASLAYIAQLQAFEAVLVGVSSLNDLKQILRSWSTIDTVDIGDPTCWAWNISDDLDPRVWIAKESRKT